MKAPGLTLLITACHWLTALTSPIVLFQEQTDFEDCHAEYQFAFLEKMHK